jgi:hypothetical protein
MQGRNYVSKKRNLLDIGFLRLPAKMAENCRFPSRGLNESPEILGFRSLFLRARKSPPEVESGGPISSFKTA